MVGDGLDQLAEAVVYWTLLSSSIAFKHRQMASDPTHFNAAQLKTIPKVITLVECCVFSVPHLNKRSSEMSWSDSV
jgi:uncharacterized protein (DUF486 family)